MPDTADRFYAPAEEAIHSRTWMCWPSTASFYKATPGYFADVQATIGRLAAAIAQNEPVTMLAAARWHPLARQLCGPRVDLADVPTNDMWARDSGPVFVRNSKGQKAAVKFNFNGWGKKMPHKLDNRVADAVASLSACQTIVANVVGEGGGVEYDGEGTLLLTDSCWVNDNRNPGRTQAQIEAELARVLGIDKVIWLPGVRGQEETDGHIDGVIRFVRPGLVLMSGVSGDTSEWGQAYDRSKAILARQTDAKGRRFAIVELPFAQKWRSVHDQFFSGYANYYVGNGAVYSPQFGDKAGDALAEETLARLYPDRRIVMLNMDRIYENGGGIHCVTQQEPA